VKPPAPEPEIVLDEDVSDGVEPARLVQRKGRGALSNATGRFETEKRVSFFDGWEARAGDDDAAGDDATPSPRTTIIPDATRTLITRNQSPDICFDQSINPYKGCEHGCIYCFARPTHSYLGMSAGLDFETKILAKLDGPELLRAELARRGYRCSPIAVGANTDPYQPSERTQRITRGILEVLAEHDHPVMIITKSGLIARDLDILAPMAAKNLVHVSVSVTTLDPQLTLSLEPRASRPRRRLDAIRALAGAGVPVGVLAAPMIPAINDFELERILAASREAGATEAGYVLLRLPHEVKDLFTEWLEAHFPDRKERVLSLVRQTRDGKLYDSAWGFRGRGTGEYADLLRRRFDVACRRLGFNQGRPDLDVSLFRGATRQLPLLF